MKKETIIISLGGSLIVPGEIDTKFLSDFKSLIQKHLNKKKFIIICGGGKTARFYQSAGASLKIKQENQDWLGIYSTWINAQLVRSLFNAEFLFSPDKPKSKNKILIAGGWKTGWSTDYVAVEFAKKIKAKKLINLSNIDYAFDKDPKKHKDAKPIKETTWKEFRKILPKKWSPGLNSPFDPVASRLAQHLGIEVAIINGKNLKNLDLCLNNKNFKGTRIK